MADRPGPIDVMTGRPWTADELRVVVVNYSLGVEYCMSLLPGRTKEAIRGCAKFIGVAPPRVVSPDVV